MTARRVTPGNVYHWDPVMLDQFDRNKMLPVLTRGELLTVVNRHGCPPANTMGHCYVQRQDGEFAGLVCTNSLVTCAEWDPRSAGMEKAQ